MTHRYQGVNEGWTIEGPRLLLQAFLLPAMTMTLSQAAVAARQRSTDTCFWNGVRKQSPSVWPSAGTNRQLEAERRQHIHNICTYLRWPHTATLTSTSFDAPRTSIKFTTASQEIESLKAAMRDGGAALPMPEETALKQRIEQVREF